MGRLLNIVGVRCEPAKENKYVDWLRGTHVPMILKFKGLRRVTHTKLANADDTYPQYVNIFEFEDEKAFEEYEKSPELAAAMAEMHETWKDGGWQRIWRVQYQALKSWNKDQE